MNIGSSPSLDCLAIGAHPDDSEIGAGGTLALMARLGRRVGILSLTRGESGTRGTPELRAEEARAAAAILGAEHCGMLDLGDGDIANDQENRRAVVEAIRRLRPRVILTNGPDDRHPDHRRARELVHDAVFLANVGGFRAEGARWLTEAVAFFYQHQYFSEERADWIVDISETFETKMKALYAYGSQFAGTADDADPAKATYIASPEFLEQIRDRSRSWGHRIGARHGEPFLLDRPAHAMHPLVRLVTADGRTPA